MSHHSSNINGEGTSHKDPLSRILDELSFLKLWKEKLERKEKKRKREDKNKSRCGGTNKERKKKKNTKRINKRKTCLL